MFTAALCLLYEAAVKTGFMTGSEGTTGSTSTRFWDV